MNRQDAEEWTQALGQIVAGSWRQVALAKRLGVPKALGLNTEEWVNKRLGGYVKQGVEERREAAKELKADGYSTREIGEVLGVGVGTVHRDLVPNGTPQATGTKGAAADDAGSVPNGTAPLDAVAALAFTKPKNPPRATQGTSDIEWYTPDEYLQAARDVLGRIDLDPASSVMAQEKVRADRFFTIEDNGLRQEWHGNVWLNPPYAQPNIALFASKMVAEFKSGRVTAAVMLTHNYTDTRWFHELLAAANLICFTRGRIGLVNADGSTGPPTQGQPFFYFGDATARFAARFAAVGFVLRAWSNEVETVA